MFGQGSADQGGTSTLKESAAQIDGRRGGQGLVEYRLIIALVAVLAIAGLVLFGPALNALLSSVSGSV